MKSFSVSTVALAAATAVLAGAPIAVDAGWNPDRVHHVDAVGQAHLFRGPSPTSSDVFVFDDMRTTLQAMAQKEGNATLPDEFDLVVVSMLNNLKESEAKELAAETKFFDSLPSPTGAPGNGSKLVHWPIVGDIISPHASVTKKQCLASAAKYDTRPDHMVSKMKDMRAMLEAAQDTPTVVYFHCDAGMDRTGEVYGDYMMTYRNQTYKEVLAYDNQIEGPTGREIHTISKQAIEWMCLYLQLQPGSFNPQCDVCQ